MLQNVYCWWIWCCTLKHENISTLCSPQTLFQTFYQFKTMHWLRDYVKTAKMLTRFWVLVYKNTSFLQRSIRPQINDLVGIRSSAYILPVQSEIKLHWDKNANTSSNWQAFQQGRLWRSTWPWSLLCLLTAEAQKKGRTIRKGPAQLWQFHTKAALLSNSVQSVSVKFTLFHRHISWNSKQARPETGLLSRVIPLLTGPNQGLVLLPLKRSEASNCPTIWLCCGGVHPQSHMRIGLGEVTGLWEECDLGCFWRTTLSVTRGVK